MFKLLKTYKITPSKKMVQATSTNFAELTLRLVSIAQMTIMTKAETMPLALRMIDAMAV